MLKPALLGRPLFSQQTITPLFRAKMAEVELVEGIRDPQDPKHQQERRVYEATAILTALTSQNPAEVKHAVGILKCFGGGTLAATYMQLVDSKKLTLDYMRRFIGICVQVRASCSAVGQQTPTARPPPGYWAGVLDGNTPAQPSAAIEPLNEGIGEGQEGGKGCDGRDPGTGSDSSTPPTLSDGKDVK